MSKTNEKRTENNCDNKLVTSQQLEYELSCLLKSKKEVQNFLIEVLIRMIDKLLDYGETQTTIVSIMIEIYKEKTKQLLKPGMSRNLSIKVIKLIKDKKYKEVYRLLEGENKFHQVMGAIYGMRLIEGKKGKFSDFVLYCVENNTKLKDMVMSRLKNMFCLPDDISWEQVKKLVGTGKNTAIYFSMIVDVENCPESNFRRNLNKAVYIRSMDNINSIYISSPKKEKNCHNDITRNRKAKLVTANSYYNVNDTFFQKVLEYYDRTSLAGPSGSVVLLYDYCFKLLGMEASQKNKMLVLCCAIADYVPYFHTLTEILISYSHEIKLGYTIDKDPVRFVIKLLDKNKIL